MLDFKNSSVLNDCFVKEDGLTLLHVLIGLVLFSLFFIPFVQMEKINDIQDHRDREELRISDIDAKLTEYAARVGAYPAPANPLLWGFPPIVDLHRDRLLMEWFVWIVPLGLVQGELRQMC